ncbi:MAG: PIN domain-containing protein, partial [Blautia wexlerae]
MKIIKTYYLIDYENVGSEGFKGCEKLRETDIIHLFYTDNSRKIDLDIINDHGESKLITHKVPTGNQSADMHLGSYLGYLIGKECTG